MGQRTCWLVDGPDGVTGVASPSKHCATGLRRPLSSDGGWGMADFNVTRLDIDGVASGLLAVYEHAVASGQLAVATVESPTGWGKSTAVCVFYEALRRAHDEDGYWPIELTGGRHELFPPELKPAADAAMPFFWWGLHGQLDRVRGIATARPAALDGEWQLRVLAQPIVEALDRYDRRWGTRIRAGLALSSLVLPTLGHLPRIVEEALAFKDAYDRLQSWREAAAQVVDAVMASEEGVRRALRAPEARDPFVTSRTSQADVAWHGAARLLAQLSRVVPIVIAVEDAQLLDEASVLLLRELHRSQGLGLILLTIASDRLADPDHLATWLGKLTVGRHLPPRGLAGNLFRIALRSLTVDEICDIARARLADEYGSVAPTAASGIVRAAQAVSGSVLLMHELLDEPAVARSLADGSSVELAESVLRAAAAEDGRRAQWQRFDDNPQRGLAVASLFGLFMHEDWLVAAIDAVGECGTLRDLAATGWLNLHGGEAAVRDAATLATLNDLRMTVLTSDEVALVLRLLRRQIEGVRDREIWHRTPLRIRLEALRAASAAAAVDSSSAAFAVELAELQARTGQPRIYRQQTLEYLIPFTRALRPDSAAVSELAAGLVDDGDASAAVDLLQARLNSLRNESISSETLLCRQELATALAADGRYSDAIEELRHVVMTRQSTEVPESNLLDLAAVSLYECLAEVLRWDEAHQIASTRYGALIRRLGQGHDDTLEWGRRSAVAMRNMEQLAGAHTLLRQLIRAAEQNRAPNDHRLLVLRLEAARTSVQAATAHDHAAAIAELRALDADAQMSWGEDAPIALATHTELALAYHHFGRISQAIELHEGTLAVRCRCLGERHPDTIHNRHDLANAYRAAGAFDEAIQTYEETLADATAVLGRRHPVRLSIQNNLAVAYRVAGRLDDAIEVYEANLREKTQLFGEHHRSTVTTRHNLGVVLQKAGRTEEAITLSQQALDDRIDLLGGYHPDTLITRDTLAGAYRDAGRLDDAITQYDQTLQGFIAVLGEGHPDTLICRINLAGAYQEADRLDEAIRLLERTLADTIDGLGHRHPITLSARNNLAVAYARAERLTDAITLLEENLAQKIEVLGERHPDTLLDRSNLAGAYLGADRLNEGIPLLEHALADLNDVLGDRHPRALNVRRQLAAAYRTAGRLDDAIPLYEQTLTDRINVLGRQHADTVTSRAELADIYRQVGREAEADQILAI